MYRYECIYHYVIYDGYLSTLIGVYISDRYVCTSYWYMEPRVPVQSESESDLVCSVSPWVSLARLGDLDGSVDSESELILFSC